jgi:hypothetical protein
LASKRRIRRKACEGKIHYTSLEAAKEACIRMNNSKKESCHPYKCQFGPHYHVGHAPDKVKQIIAARQVEKRGWSWD